HYGIGAGQISVTSQDTEERRRYLNARSTITKLLEWRAVPVINENDTVATNEIRYGDNDRLAARVATMTSAGPRWTGKPRRIFWNAHGDTFHEKVPDEWIDRVFAVCALSPQHIHMISTKRSARMLRYMMDKETRSKVMNAAMHIARDRRERALAVWSSETWPLPNVMLGVSVEDQTRADERREDFRATPAAVKFVS
ncbi:hypothetical protein OY671_009377, partial [Metschnikowia pulcherrima]